MLCIKLVFVSLLLCQATTGFIPDIFSTLPNPLDIFKTLLQLIQSDEATENSANSLFINIREFVSNGIKNVVSEGAQQAVNPINDIIVALASEVMQSTDNAQLKEQAEVLLNSVEDFKNGFVETLSSSMENLLPTLQKIYAPDLAQSPYVMANAAADLMENTRDAASDLINILKQFGEENSFDISDITDMLHNSVETTIQPILDGRVLTDLAYKMKYYICYVFLRIDCRNPLVDFVFEGCKTMPIQCARHKHLLG